MNKKLWKDWLGQAVVGEIFVYWNGPTLHECWFRHDVFKAAVAGQVFLSQKRVVGTEPARFEYRATRLSWKAGEKLKPIGWRP